MKKYGLNKPLAIPGCAQLRATYSQEANGAGIHMIFKYTAAGQKRLSLSEWYLLEKWPHQCPKELYHQHFIVVKSGREYRCGPALSAHSAQVSAMIYHAESDEKDTRKPGDHHE